MTMPPDRLPTSNRRSQPRSSQDIEDHAVGKRLACEACRKRKIKCGGQRPECSRCQERDLECAYLTPMPSWSLVKNLQDRIRELEARHPVSLPDLHPDHVQSEPSRLPPPETLTRIDPSPTRGLSSPVPIDVPSRQTGPQFPSNTQLLDHLPATMVIPSPLEQPDSDTLLLLLDATQWSLPNDSQVSDLLDHFQSHTNSAFPLFHAPTLKNMVNRVCFSGSRSTVHDLATVMFVLAVSSASLPVSSPLHQAFRSQSRVFWNDACRLYDRCPVHAGVHTLEILILKSQYVLYEPDCGNVWDLSGAAVRQAVDLGLHRDSTSRSRNQTFLQIDMQRRLFWCAYCLDRLLSFGLGRPPAIADDWITTQLPSPVDDSLLADQGVLSGDPSPGKLGTLYHFQIRRLQSEIQYTLYCPIRLVQGTPPQTWYDSILLRLDNLRSGALPSTGFMNAQWLDVNYYHTKVLLYRPAPNCALPDRDGLENAVSAASGMIKAYKAMYRMGRINYHWIAMYHLFTIGVTYMVSLWQAHRNNWSIVPSLVAVVMDIQVCSSIMEALAALTPGTSNIRNAFETLSERIIKHLTTLGGGFSVPGSPAPADVVRLSDGLPDRTGAPLSSQEDVWVNSIMTGLGDDANLVFDGDLYQWGSDLGFDWMGLPPVADPES